LFNHKKKFINPWLKNLIYKKYQKKNYKLFNKKEAIYHFILSKIPLREEDINY